MSRVITQTCPGFAVAVALTYSALFNLVFVPGIPRFLFIIKKSCACHLNLTFVGAQEPVTCSKVPTAILIHHMLPVG